MRIVKFTGLVRSFQVLGLSRRITTARHMSRRQAPKMSAAVPVQTPLHE